MRAISPVLPSSPQFEEVVLAKDQPQYLPLPVALVTLLRWSQAMISRYQLTWRERLQVFLTGRVWWQQLTFGDSLQPQKMYVSEPLR